MTDKILIKFYHVLPALSSWSKTLNTALKMVHLLRLLLTNHCTGLQVKSQVFIKKTILKNYLSYNKRGRGTCTWQ